MVKICIFYYLILGLNDEPVKKFACPPGVREVNCFVDPCLVSFI
jgi:hypothetical protein